MASTEERATAEAGKWLLENRHHVAGLLEGQADRCRRQAAVDKREGNESSANLLIENATKWEQLKAELDALPQTFDPWEIEGE